VSAVSRLDRRLAELAGRGRKALVPFITAGDPGLDATVPVMHALVAAGADIIELGVPFSDPMADGVVIQKSSERALARGLNTPGLFAMVAEFRQRDADTPVVLMGYLNPIERRGWEWYAAQAAQAGVDALLIVDLPPEEAGDARALLNRHGLQLIALLAPTTDGARLREACAQAQGYQIGSDRIDASPDFKAVVRARVDGNTVAIFGIPVVPDGCVEDFRIQRHHRR